MTVSYNPHDVELLHIQTERLCAVLDEIHPKLKKRTLGLEDFKEPYHHFYQPEVVALGAAMRYYQPREKLNPFNGELADMRTLQTPLITTTQLHTIANILRGLAAYLPERVRS